MFFGFYDNNQTLPFWRLTILIYIKGGSPPGIAVYQLHCAARTIISADTIGGHSRGWKMIDQKSYKISREKKCEKKRNHIILYYVREQRTNTVYIIFWPKPRQYISLLLMLRRRWPRSGVFYCSNFIHANGRSFKNRKIRITYT